jgi:hypothetical protein
MNPVVHAEPLYASPFMATSTHAGACLGILNRGRQRRTWILAVLLCLVTVAGVCQEVVIEWAESDFLESVQGADGIHLDGYAGPLLPTDGNEANGFVAASAPSAYLTLLAGRVLSLRPTSFAETAPALVMTVDVQGLVITWPASAAELSLETTSNLGDPNSWQPVSPPPQGQSYRPALIGVARFYRLRSP